MEGQGDFEVAGCIVGELGLHLPNMHRPRSSAATVLLQGELHSPEPNGVPVY